MPFRVENTTTLPASFGLWHIPIKPQKLADLIIIFICNYNGHICSSNSSLFCVLISFSALMQYRKQVVFYLNINQFLFYLFRSKSGKLLFFFFHFLAISVCATCSLIIAWNLDAHLSRHHSMQTFSAKPRRLWLTLKVKHSQASRHNAQIVKVMTVQKKKNKSQL